jgi:hypothetical protein
MHRSVTLLSLLRLRTSSRLICRYPNNQQRTTEPYALRQDPKALLQPAYDGGPQEIRALAGSFYTFDNGAWTDRGRRSDCSQGCNVNDEVTSPLRKELHAQHKAREQECSDRYSPFRPQISCASHPYDGCYLVIEEPL